MTYRARSQLIACFLLWAATKWPLVAQAEDPLGKVRDLIVMEQRDEARAAAREAQRFYEARGDRFREALSVFLLAQLEEGESAAVVAGDLAEGCGSPLTLEAQSFERPQGAALCAGLILGLLLTRSADAQPPRRGEILPERSAGVFVGVEKFAYDFSLEAVNFAVNDAVDLAHAIAIEYGLIPSNRVLLLLATPSS